MKRIELTNMPNTRDLSYIYNKDGKQIKPYKLIRSGATAQATTDDIAILVNQYHLKRVIDFRTLHEINEQPDYLIDGIIYIFNPIIETFKAGVTHEKDIYKQKPKNQLEWLARTIEEMNFTVKDNMKFIYDKILSDEFSIKHYQSFFHILLEETDGATLYHCSAGKDRVGIGTILLLSALDVDRQAIIDDYLFTNNCYQKDIDKIMEDMKQQNFKDSIIEQIPYCQGVCKEYVEHIFDIIDNKHHGINSYLHDVLKLTDADLNKLKQIYLK